MLHKHPNARVIPAICVELARSDAMFLRGIHLVLQTRTRVLDGTLRPLFERWYSGLANGNQTGAAQLAAVA